MACLVGIYDAWREWWNPASVRKSPWQSHKPNCHDLYYDQFLIQQTKGQKYKAQLAKARSMVRQKIADISCGPIFIRLAWHDSGTFDKNNEGKGSWPCAGGALGSIRFDKEITAGPNAGLAKALKYYEPIKAACPALSWADLIQMGSAEAIEAMGGPKIPLRYGRLDADKSPDLSVAPFGLPDALPPFGGGPSCAQSPAAHLRYVFYKYGMNDQEIVALSGAHTVGRAFKDRSGAVPYGYSNATAYTAKGCPFAMTSQTNGGQSWTKEWLKFDNSYFQMPMQGQADKECIAFPTDRVLTTDPGFKPTFQKYARDQGAFFAEYAMAHKKLSELGSKFDNEVDCDANSF